MRTITVTASVMAPLIFAGTMCAQVFSNSSLNGKYFARHVQFAVDANNSVTDARSITGAITFDGKGGYAFAGQQVIGTGAAANYAVNGTYTMQPSGIVTLTNPQTTSATVNARFGAELITGTTTEISANAFDLFVAIPAPSAATDSNATLSVQYVMVNFELTSASTSLVRNAYGNLQFDGLGGLTTNGKISGHGASISGGSFVQQAGYSGTYKVNTDGTGTITFQTPAGQASANSLVAAGARNLAVSASGNVILVSTPGAHDILVGLQDAAASNITPASFSGRYWASTLEVDVGKQSQSNVASITVVPQNSETVLTERLHTSGFPSQADFTTSGTYGAITGNHNNVIVGVGQTLITLGNASTLVAGDFGVDFNGQPSGVNKFNIAVGTRIPALSGNGVFVNPQGVVDAASFAPVGQPISPGEFIAIFGSGLAAQPQSITYPYPTTLGGVTVSIGGLPAPIQLVAPGQINCLVPYGVSTTGGPVPIVVTNNNTPSNTVNVPVAAAEPGVFSTDQSGIGEGAVTFNATGALVNAGNPAAAGDVLVVYLTGLGALQNPVVDGHAPNPAGPDNSQVTVMVQIDGVNSPKIYYAGINPVFPGLYQVDFQMPQIPDHGDVDVLVLAIAADGTVTGTDQISVFAQ